MATTLTPSNRTGMGALAWMTANRWPLVAALLFVGGIAALGLATYRPNWLPGRSTQVADRLAKNIGQQAGDAAKTVAGLFDLRSPGERAAGALASLKQKRQPLLHERALAKVRRPLSPLAAIVAAPPVPPGAPVPLFNAVVGPKGAPGVPAALTAPPGGPPIVFPGLTLLPGGGGVIIPPPTTTTIPPDTPTPTPVVLVPPTTPGVPEPGSWALMLIGFAMIGGMVRRMSAVDAT